MIILSTTSVQNSPVKNSSSDCPWERRVPVLFDLLPPPVLLLLLATSIVWLTAVSAVVAAVVTGVANPALPPIIMAVGTRGWTTGVMGSYNVNNKSINRQISNPIPSSPLSADSILKEPCHEIFYLWTTSPRPLIHELKWRHWHRYLGNSGIIDTAVTGTALSLTPLSNQLCRIPVGIFANSKILKKA
jgi:hypothetical protein